MSTDDAIGDQGDLDPEVFRELGYYAIDLITDYYRRLADEPVYKSPDPTDVVSLFDEPVPESGEDPRTILDAWREDVLPNSTPMGSPRYFGYVMGSGVQMGVLAEALAAAQNANTGGWKPAPAATEIERRVVAWFAEMIGYPTDTGGLLTSGGTVANLVALATALQATADYDVAREGLQSELRPGRFTLYVADHEGHSSIVRAARVLGLGEDAVRLVPSDDDYRMDVTELVSMLDDDADHGLVPFCVVAQAGSINVGTIDPIDELATVCERRDLWLHVDGACGAFGAILPEKRPQFAGIERADSVTVDPHKWLYVPFECGSVLVNDGGALGDTFEMHAAYVDDHAPEEYTGHSFFDSGLQMSRGFRALKVWMSLKATGLDGYRELLGRNVAQVELLDERVKGHDDFESFHAPNLFMYSFRYAPADIRAALESDRLDGTGRDPVERYLDEANDSIAASIQESGLGFLTTTEMDGHVALRMSICNHRTTEEDVEVMFDAFAEAGAEFDDASREFLVEEVPALAE